MSTVPSSTSYVDQMQSTGNSSAFAPSMAMGQKDFLLLLTTQMMNQDPTKPMDPTSFVTDLTQMSQLESTQQLNKSMLAMTAGFQNMQVMQAASLVGRAVIAEGEVFNHNPEYESHFRLDSEEPLTDVKIIITNEKGVVREMDAMGTLNAGETNVKWDGLNDDGGEAAGGSYKLLAYGYDADGNIKGIKTVVATSVYSVSVNTDGSLKLTLSTGERVDMSAVREIG